MCHINTTHAYIFAHPHLRFSNIINFSDTESAVADLSYDVRDLKRTFEAVSKDQTESLRVLLKTEFGTLKNKVSINHSFCSKFKLMIYL